MGEETKKVFYTMFGLGDAMSQVFGDLEAGKNTMQRLLNLC